MRPLFDPDATYLVTGGLGGFGLRLLPYLVASGARHLTLLDRDPRRGRDAAWIRRSSALAYMDREVELDIVTGDVAVEEDVQRCVAQLQRPLKGVFHLAGTLDDRLLDDLSAESVARVFAAKAHGALHLHRATLGSALDCFVLFSSTASALGNPGQINYAAANGFLDGSGRQSPAARSALPRIRHGGRRGCRDGRPQSPRAAHDADCRRAPGQQRFRDCQPRLRAARDVAIEDHLVTALFERPSWTVDSPDYMRLGRLMRNQDAFAAGAAGELTVDGVVAQIAAKVAELCGHEEGGVEEPLSSFGLTSISVAELGTFIQTQFNYRVSALELMTTASALSLAQGIVHGKEDVEEDRAEAATSGTNDAGAAVGPRTRRAPSAFANPRQDHFPRGSGVASDALAVH